MPRSNGLLRSVIAIALGSWMFATAPAQSSDAWRTHRGDRVAVECQPRHDGFAERLVRDFPTYLARVCELLDVPADAVTARPVRFVVGADAATLRRRLGIRLPDWAAGVAVKATNRIGLNAWSFGSPSDMQPATVIRHEIAHLAIGAALGPDKSIPRWLEEGICQWIGGRSYLGTRRDLLDHLSFQRLIPWREITRSFPTDTLDATLAYQQSYAFVSFIARRYGTDFLLRLMRASAAEPTSRVFVRELGIAQVDAQKAWIEEEQRLIVSLAHFTQVVTPIALCAGIVVIAQRRRRRRDRALIAAMDDADERDDVHSLDVGPAPTGDTTDDAVTGPASGPSGDPDRDGSNGGRP